MQLWLLASPGHSEPDIVKMRKARPLIYMNVQFCCLHEGTILHFSTHEMAEVPVFKISINEDFNYRHFYHSNVEKCKIVCMFIQNN